MPRTRLGKEKWTLTFDPHLKNFIIEEARKQGIYPVNLLEQIVRERYNPYGHVSVKDSVSYVRKLRRESRDQADEAFLEEIRKWQESNS